MKKIYTSIIAMMVMHLTMAQTKTIHYVFTTQPSFTTNLEQAPIPFVREKGSYLTGRAVYDTSTGQGGAPVNNTCQYYDERGLDRNWELMNSNVSRTDCGTTLAYYESRTHTVIPPTTPGSVNYHWNVRTPAYTGVRQDVSCSSQDGDPRIVLNYTGSCGAAINESVVESDVVELEVRSLEFKTLITNLQVHCIGDVVEMSNAFNRYSVPVNYGEMYYKIDGATAASAIIDPMSHKIFTANMNPGIYTITAVLPFFQGEAEASFQLEVQGSLPNAGSDISLCRYQSVNLFESSVSKTGSWSGISGLSANGDLNTENLSPGVYNATLTISTGSCVNQDVKKVTIQNAPSAISFDDMTICSNDGEIQLPSRSNSNNKAWLLYSVNEGTYIPSNLISSAFTMNTNDLVANSTYSLRYVESNTATGCESFDNVSLIVNEATALDLGANVTLCINGSNYDILQDIPVETINLGGEFSYDGNYMAGNTTIFLPSQAGIGTHIITYTFTNSKGCTSIVTKNIRVVSDLLLIEDNTPDDYYLTNQDTVLVGERVSFTSMVSGFEFEYNFGDGGYATEASPAYYFYKPGVYDITFTSKNNEGCGVQVFTENRMVVLENTNKIPLIDVCEAVDMQQEELKIILFPNPVDTYVNIDFFAFPYEKLSQIEQVHIVLSDLAGSKLQEGSYQIPAGKLLQVDLSNLGLPPGTMFLLELSYNDTHAVYRLITK